MPAPLCKTQIKINSRQDGFERLTIYHVAHCREKKLQPRCLSSVQGARYGSYRIMLFLSSSWLARAVRLESPNEMKKKPFSARDFCKFIMRNRNWRGLPILTLALGVQNAKSGRDNCKYIVITTHTSSSAREHFKVSITISMLITSYFFLFDWKWNFKIIFELMRCQCEGICTWIQWDIFVIT